MTLIDKIANKTVKSAVIGLGYVGLPLAVTMAKAGFRVIGIEKSQERVELVMNGISYVADTSSETLGPLVQNGKIQATTDYSQIEEVDTINICVPTPLRKSKDPDMSFIVSAVNGIVPYLRSDQLVILESTTYPGTTEELILPALEKNALKVGKDFHLAFSPERIDPGNKEFYTVNTPKIVGGVTPKCTEVAKLFYEQFINKIHTVSSPRSAEMVKLLENTFRNVNIALVNEFALMCDKMKIDVWEIIDAAATKPFGFMPFYPGPGLGGHCIPIDPHYLSWKAKSYQFYARFIELASEINASMPEYVLRKISDALNQNRKSINGAKILMVGIAYKRNVGDTRESPAIDIMRLLIDRGCHFTYHDPYVEKFHLEPEMKKYRSINLDAEIIKNFDCTVIMTDHTKIDYELIVENSTVVIDTRNITKTLKTNYHNKVIKI